MSSASAEILIGMALFMTYWFLVLIFKDRLKKRNITSLTPEYLPPILMIRTKRGLKFLDRISRYRRFWELISNIGIPAVFFGMAYMFFLIILMDYILFTTPLKPSLITSPRSAFLIPGLNPYIPLIWGLIGLIVTLIVHEFSHAILCRAEGARVKSLGILFALVPIGGFAELDEKDLMSEKIKRIQRIRIFSAGVISNFMVAFISFLIFFNLLNCLTPHIVILNSDVVEKGSVLLKINDIDVFNQKDVENIVKSSKNLVLEIRDKNGNIKRISVNKITGVYVSDVLRDYPAAKAGIKGKTVIVEVNGSEVLNIKRFIEIMKKTRPGDIISVKTYDGKSFKSFSVKLVKSPNGDYGFMGVIIGGDYLSGMILGYSDQILWTIKQIPRDPKGLLYLTAMPFYFSGFSDEMFNYFSPSGFWKNTGYTIYYLLNLFYWIGWINFYVGLFNCLPAIPLDGGRVLNETLLTFLRSKRGEKISFFIVRSLALFIFLSIILSLIIPNLLIK